MAKRISYILSLVLFVVFAVTVQVTFKDWPAWLRTVAIIVFCSFLAIIPALILYTAVRNWLHDNTSYRGDPLKVDRWLFSSSERDRNRRRH